MDNPKITIEVFKKGSTEKECERLTKELEDLLAKNNVILSFTLSKELSSTVAQIVAEEYGYPTNFREFETDIVIATMKSLSGCDSKEPKIFNGDVGMGTP